MRRSPMQVATQLMAHDALGAHLRDELGIHELLAARPLQAAVGVRGQLRGRGGRPARDVCSSRRTTC